MFTGDEHLHPLLCYVVDPECFELSSPQKMALSSWMYSFANKEQGGAIILPTGMGKTVLAAAIGNIWYDCQRGPNNTCRILFVAHQREILDQAIKTFANHTRFGPNDFGIVYQTGDLRVQQYAKTKTVEEHLNARVVFASIQSLSDAERLSMLPSNHFGLIIVDEFHHYKATTYLPAIEHFADVKYLLGLSATPFRGDLLNPMETFDKNYLYRMDLTSAIWQGYLTWPSWEIIPDKTNYNEIINQIKGKVSKSKLRKLYTSERIKLIVEKYHEHVQSRQTIAFCNSRKHAEQMAKAFLKPSSVGAEVPPIKAANMDSTMSSAERTATMAAFQRGELQMICVIGLFDEGVNIPDVGAILILRKTSSPVKAIQQIGRGLRLAPGKRDVKVLDFTGNYDDLESIFNLGIVTGINVNQIARQMGKSVLIDEPDEFPIIPPINFKLGKEVKFYIKNITDTAIRELNSLNRHRALALRKQHNLFATEISKKLGTSVGNVMRWLKGAPIERNEATLVAAIADLLEAGLDDASIEEALSEHLEDYNYAKLKKKALGKKQVD